MCAGMGELMDVFQNVVAVPVCDEQPNAAC